MIFDTHAHYYDEAFDPDRDALLSALPPDADVSLGEGREWRDCSARELVAAAQALMEKIADPALLVRRLTLTAGRVLTEEEAQAAPVCRQLDLFHDWGAEAAKEQQAAARRAREKKMQAAMLGIKKKYGKNAILKGMDLEDGATGKLRGGLIGGHKA